MGIKTYDLKRVLLTVNGVPIRGFQRGDAITVAFDSDAWTKVVGGDGEVVRARMNDDTGKITIRLLQAAEATDQLEAMRRLDQELGTGVSSVLIRDLSSGTEVFAKEAWVVKPPDLGFGTEAGTREWVLDTGKLDVRAAGIPAAVPAS